jgi:hypothetical protein
MPIQKELSSLISASHNDRHPITQLLLPKKKITTINQL